MHEKEQDNQEGEERLVVGPGYAGFQLARALTTEAENPDAETRARAARRVADWQATLRGILDGTLAVGGRTPVGGVPEWATLKVLTGGFATGELLAEGPLQDHERATLARLPAVSEADARRTLNAYYLGDDGLTELQSLLQSGAYDVNVPEEGALLTVAWLVGNGHAEDARALLEVLAPWFARLRFYPVPTDRPRPSGARVALQTVGETLKSLERISPNEHILAQKEAVEVWAPLYDRAVALFLETVEGETPDLRRDAEGRPVPPADGKFPVEGGWPCQKYPEGWADRATALLAECETRRAKRPRYSRQDDPSEPFGILLQYLRACVTDPAALTGREVGRVRQILACYVAKRGVPGSERHAAFREAQARQVSAPTFAEIARVVTPRLQAFPPGEGLDEPGAVTAPVSEAEARDVPAGTPIPRSIRAKVERCLRDTVDALVERGLITSGETLARLLPQMTSGIRAAGIGDPALRRLYAAVYAAFRRRRSLLLLNLESQVRIEELPWVAAMDRFRRDGFETKGVARQAMDEVTALTVAAFPFAILPNKLLQELRALGNTAGLNLPLVDEVAADIFMGEFSGKFLEAAQRAGVLLDGTLYATYYAIDYGQVQRMKVQEPAKRYSFWQTKSGEFATLCANRAGVPAGRSDPATNGMIIEQQQILTTQNLAVLFAALDLSETLGDRLDDLPRECFRWVCRRLQVRTDNWHARLIMVKNTAYAWRQMVFFLALLPPARVADFLTWAEAHLAEQPAPFQDRFRPALMGLALAAQGVWLESDGARLVGARRFLGWIKGRHWLLGAE